MRLVSFNVNGIRARLHQIEAVIQQLKPDVLGIQEVKAQDQDFPYAAIADMGYHVETFGQKGHYGVALLSREKPLWVQRGFPFDEPDAQRRLISAGFTDSSGKEYTVINGYFPQGDSREHEWKFPYKTRFYADLSRWLEEAFDPKDALAIMGDFNVAAHDRDIGIGADNAKRWLRSGKCSFLPEERLWFKRLEHWGLTEAYRYFVGHDLDDNARKFSWFDYRSKGFDREPRRGLRIDGVLLSAALLSGLRQADIDYAIRGMERPSDHAPIWVEIQR